MILATFSADVDEWNEWISFVGILNETLSTMQEAVTNLTLDRVEFTREAFCLED